MKEEKVSFLKYQYALKMLETEIDILLEEFVHRRSLTVDGSTYVQQTLM